MNDTPETAAASFNYDTFNGVDPWKGERFIKVVPAKLAAQLEHELAEARAEVAALKTKVARLQWCVRENARFRGFYFESEAEALGGAKEETK